MMLVSIKSKFIKMTVDVLPQQDREICLGFTTYDFQLLTWREQRQLITITRLSHSYSYPSCCPATLELISLLFSNLLLLLTESSSTFIPNSVALIIVLELNVLSDEPVLTSIPFEVEFMMVLPYTLLLEESAFK